MLKKIPFELKLFFLSRTAIRYLAKTSEKEENSFLQPGGGRLTDNTDLNLIPVTTTDDAIKRNGIIFEQQPGVFFKFLAVF